jgi:MOB kinase activator 1
MSVPTDPIVASTAAATTSTSSVAAPPSSSQLPLSLSPTALYNTVQTSRCPLTEPPSYLSPIVRALKTGTCGLTPPSNARTRAPFKPRSAAKGTSSYQLRQFAEATLGSGSLRKAVMLPEGEDLNEWLAVNGELLIIWLV